tara:strand:+ start:118 stop:843 length:726 start_codon:yes stop_codon:yes gene_type:complete
MKKNIIFKILLFILFIGATTTSWTVGSKISDNSEDVKGMRKALKTLQIQLNAKTDIYDNVLARQTVILNSINNLEDRINSLEYETSKDILNVLSLLDELRQEVENFENTFETSAEIVNTTGATGGFGVLTGTQALGQSKEVYTEPLSEPETPFKIAKEIIPSVPCPTPTSRRNFGTYIKNITLKNSQKFNVNFDLESGTPTNINITEITNSRLIRAVNRYILDLNFKNVTTKNCSIPFTIN